jgi:hypothetical protein
LWYFGVFKAFSDLMPHLHAAPDEAGLLMCLTLFWSLREGWLTSCPELLWILSSIPLHQREESLPLSCWDPEWRARWHLCQCAFFPFSLTPLLTVWISCIILNFRPIFCPYLLGFSHRLSCSPLEIFQVDLLSTIRSPFYFRKLKCILIFQLITGIYIIISIYLQTGFLIAADFWGCGNWSCCWAPSVCDRTWQGVW